MKNSAELYSKILLKYLQTNKGDLEGVKRYSDLMFSFNSILATTKAEREMYIFKELIEKQFKNEELEEGQNLAPFVCSCLEIKIKGVRVNSRNTKSRNDQSWNILKIRIFQIFFKFCFFKNIQIFQKISILKYSVIWSFLDLSFP
uniref:Uncharacterized protein n=1 Tax=Meloidogyne enterolobii TaxID=390850 RepID=A0A6V7U2E8_MELEN|nr:unnamed protein product [Meloidogyne enterolobii]